MLRTAACRSMPWVKNVVAAATASPTTTATGRIATPKLNWNGVMQLASVRFGCTRVPTIDEQPKPAGITSMFRVPIQATAEGLDVAIVGVPMDTGCTYRTGTRFGPRQIRAESTSIRPVNKETGAMPMDSLRVADIGDVNLTMYDTVIASKEITEAFATILHTGAKTLAVGGCHTITYPILRAVKQKYGPVGLIHVDAHTDTGRASRGHPVSHGTPFARAVEEGLLDCARVVQIGLRGTGYTLDDLQWGMDQGFRCVPARHCWHKSLVPLMDEVRAQMGDGPVYLSFDIDACDPCYAPGTGTLEIGGLTSIQALEIIRGCRGVNLVGADVVEVSPPYDHEGMTAHLGANLLYEMLCVMPNVMYKDIPV